MRAADLRIKLFADGAEIAQILKASANPLIKGFTTNPTLMRAAGIQNYEAFAREILGAVKNKPISFEVFADDFGEMERQARKISDWGENVYVKIPITNTKGASAMPLAKSLSRAGVKINVTAVLTLDQVREAAVALGGGAAAVISVFAGRIADTGIDPVTVMPEALRIVAPTPNIELLWASPREVLNIFQADAIGCHIITATDNILSRLSSVGRDLREFSLETVAMFHNDAVRSGFTL